MHAETRELYRVFARYPHGALDGCPCCTSREETLAITRVPLAALRHDDLETLARKAMTTLGDEDDYRHFLPRIMELSLEPSPHLGFDHFVIGGKLDYAKWKTWPEDERAAIQKWTLALFRASLDGAYRWDEGALELATYAHLELEPFLAVAWPVDRSHAVALARAVIAFAKVHVSPAVEAWLVDPSKRAILEAAADGPGDPEVADVLRDALDVLDSPWQWKRTKAAPALEATSAPALVAPPVPAPLSTIARPPVAWLEITVAHGGDAPATYPIDAGSITTIGRGKSCTLMIRSLLAGTVNSELRTDASGTSVLCPSSPGVRIEVNGARIFGPHTLARGDVTEHFTFDGTVALRLVYRKS